MAWPGEGSRSSSLLSAPWEFLEVCQIHTSCCSVGHQTPHYRTPAPALHEARGWGGGEDSDEVPSRHPEDPCLLKAWLLAKPQLVLANFWEVTLVSPASDSTVSGREGRSGVAQAHSHFPRPWGAAVAQTPSVLSSGVSCFSVLASPLIALLARDG